MRETLAALLQADVRLRLFEAAIPSPQAWSAIGKDATVFGVRGAVADAAIVLRPLDGVALVSAVFGETVRAARALSPIERTVLERAVRAIAAACAPVCGGCETVAPLASLRGFVTFFEIAIDRPLDARIGIALSRDPEPGAVAGITLESLLDVRIEVAVRLDGTVLPAHALEAEPGACIPIGRGPALAGTVELAGRPLARGECGVRGGRYALTVSELEFMEGSTGRVS
jgi:hypothetical protein